MRKISYPEDNILPMRKIYYPLGKYLCMQYTVTEQCVAIRCRVLQVVAGCCRVLQVVAGCCRVLKCLTRETNVCACNTLLQSSVLQCVVECCRVLQGVVVFYPRGRHMCMQNTESITEQSLP